MHLVSLFLFSLFLSPSFSSPSSSFSLPFYWHLDLVVFSLFTTTTTRAVFNFFAVHSSTAYGVCVCVCADAIFVVDFCSPLSADSVVLVVLVVMVVMWMTNNGSHCKCCCCWWWYRLERSTFYLVSLSVLSVFLFHKQSTPNLSWKDAGKGKFLSSWWLSINIIF